MGGSDNYFTDDISIFRNPANICLFPNMLIGSYGVYVEKEEDSMEKQSNRDPEKPFFGGIISFSDKTKKKSPLFSLGIVLNRYDDYLGYITPGDNKFLGWGRPTTKIIDEETQELKSIVDENDYVNFLSPVCKADLILGYQTPNGFKIGLGGYLAFQHNKVVDILEERMLLAKGSIGINTPMAKAIDMEISVNWGFISQVGSYDTTAKGPLAEKQYVKLADHDFFIRADGRILSGLATLNGNFIPHGAYRYMGYKDGDGRIWAFELGMGLNINIDRGVVYCGADFVYEDCGPNNGELGVNNRSISGIISLGVERNLLFDWLVWRIGAKKRLSMVKTSDDNADVDERFT
jgi:hypothetical protein